MPPRLAVIVVAALAVAGCGEVSSQVVDAPTSVDAAVDAPLPGGVRLTVVRGGAAQGTITSNPAGIDCGAGCTATFPIGTLVTLTATPAAGATFSGWGGACSGNLPTCSIALNADVAVNADFAIQRHLVTLATAGNGSGRVTASAGGLDCPGTCTAMLDHGTQLTLTQAPGPGSTFLGWSGACAGTGPCTLTVDRDLQVSAAFGQSQSLVVTRSGTGTGTVTSSPAGITCGTDCAEVYAPGTTVTLTATATGDSQFIGWSGACTGTGPCTVTVNAATAVDARFDLRQYTLNVTRTGTGTGTVTTLAPATGINCGADCSELYDSGTMVSLLATPPADNVFTGWTGDCTNTFGPCTLTMSQARSVRAGFDLAPTVVLTLSVYGGGTVRTSPAPIMGPASCSSTDPNTTTCTLTYNRGTAVTLIPAPSTGFALVSISGCTMMGTGCVVTMSASTTVQAWFCSMTGACPI